MPDWVHTGSRVSGHWGVSFTIAHFESTHSACPGIDGHAMMIWPSRVSLQSIAVHWSARDWSSPAALGSNTAAELHRPSVFSGTRGGSIRAQVLPGPQLVRASIQLFIAALSASQL